MRAKTMEGYRKLVEEALTEAEDLRLSLGYDLEDEDEGVNLAFLDDLESQLRDLRDRLDAGTYVFEDSELPFMEILRSHARIIPYPVACLLEDVNATHRKGLNS